MRSAKRVRAIAHLPADVIIDTSCESVPERLRIEQEKGYPVNVAIDCLGGEMMGECLPYVAHGCRWIMISAMAGDMTAVNLRTVYLNNIRIIGSTLRNKPLPVKAQILASKQRSARLGPAQSVPQSQDSP